MTKQSYRNLWAAPLSSPSPAGGLGTHLRVELDEEEEHDILPQQPDGGVKREARLRLEHLVHQRRLHVREVLTREVILGAGEKSHGLYLAFVEALCCIAVVLPCRHALLYYLLTGMFALNMYVTSHKA